MALPEDGKYLIGDSVVDGHTHIFYAKNWPEETSEIENEDLVRYDYPKATTSSRGNGGYHAHSVFPSETEGVLLDIAEAYDGHTHTTIKKVKDNG